MNGMFCSHITQKTTTTDPRLAFAVDTTVGEVQHRFDASSTALQVLRGRDLTGSHFIITGANSGIGELKPRTVVFVYSLL